MKRIVLGLTFMMLTFLFGEVIDAGHPGYGASNTSLTGTYVGTVVISSTVSAGPMDLAIVLTDTAGSLSGYIDSAKLLAYPIVSTSPTVRGPLVSGARSGNSFSLQTDGFTNGNSTVSRQVVLHSAVISNSGELLTGVYSETLRGLIPTPIVVTGRFMLSRAPNLPENGQPVELQVMAGPRQVSTSGHSTVMAHLVDFYSNPVSQTVVSFAASWGTVNPPSATTNITGDVTIDFTAPPVSRPVTVTATTGNLTGTVVLNIVPLQPDAVSIVGPITGTINRTHSFTATVSPDSTTLPIAYVWQATGQSNVTHGGVMTTTDSVSFTWASAGPKLITVTATNAGGTVTGTLSASIGAPAAGTSVSGTVTDRSGSPLAGVTIGDGEGHTAVSRPDGSYTLSGLTAGKHTLSPVKSGYAFIPSSRSVSLPSDSSGQDFMGILRAELDKMIYLPLSFQNGAGWVMMKTLG